MSTIIILCALYWKSHAVWAESGWQVPFFVFDSLEACRLVCAAGLAGNASSGSYQAGLHGSPGNQSAAFPKSKAVGFFLRNQPMALVPSSRTAALAHRRGLDGRILGCQH